MKQFPHGKNLMSNIKKFFGEASCPPAVALPHRIRLAPALAAGLSLLLSGCGHVPLTTMAKLRNFDIATADPAQLRVAIRAPDWLEPREGGAAILFKLKQGDAAEREERFALEPAEEPAETAQLAGHRLPGERIRAWRIAAAEVARARAFQEEGRAARIARPGRTQFTVATALDGCRRRAARGADPDDDVAADGRGRALSAAARGRRSAQGYTRGG